MMEISIKKKSKRAVIVKSSIQNLTKDKFTITKAILWGVVNSLRMLLVSKKRQKICLIWLQK